MINRDRRLSSLCCAMYVCVASRRVLPVCACVRARARAWLSYITGKSFRLASLANPAKGLTAPSPGPGAPPLPVGLTMTVQFHGSLAPATASASLIQREIHLLAESLHQSQRAETV